MDDSVDILLVCEDLVDLSLYFVFIVDVVLAGKFLYLLVIEV